MRRIRLIGLHCSASGPDTTAAEIDRWHRDRGWDGIGYHAVVLRDGSLASAPLRPADATPAAHAPYNTGSLAVCTVGGLRGADDFAAVQLAATADVVADWCVRYGVPPTRELSPRGGRPIGIWGHHELLALDPVTNGLKTCPVYDCDELRADVVRRLAALGHVPHPRPDGPR